MFTDYNLNLWGPEVRYICVDVDTPDNLHIILYSPQKLLSISYLLQNVKIDMYVAKSRLTLLYCQT
jgi:hypothetical protein